ncbi:OmpA family protein [Paroceanicella profunda]|uniref:OmpA family protein n=1 Tax=Paroceanicella profunda TaxID=2579971 RepID=A0A5B8FHE0_9RHOB|nr:OmpA family protein [Paroceanicella profunda]QDL92087.1 OmpA family protein [Paroceanicella profunda]
MSARRPASAAALALLGGLVLAPAALALPVSPPEGAVVTLADGPREGAFPVPDAPIGPDDPKPAGRSGQVETEVWRIDNTDLNPAQLLDAARSALTDMGYALRYDCAAEACGGFDFRFALPLAGAPEMEVDLARYHYTALVNGPESIVLFASRAGSSGYVQVVSILAPPGPDAAAAPEAEAGAPDPAATGATAPQDAAADATPPVLLAELRRDGRVRLPDIDFDAGNASVLPGSAPAIAALAGMLKADPEVKVVIVGHTDATGGLDANLALSKARAEAIRTVLLRDHGIAAARVAAAGVGPLSPITNNATDAARARNRRVEVVLQ